LTASAALFHPCPATFWTARLLACEDRGADFPVKRKGRRVEATRDQTGALPDEADPSPAPGQVSALLAEIARAPETELASAWAKQPEPGDVLGRFELLRQVGHGGFGVVFEAQDRELRRRVALKLFRPGARAGRKELLAREAEAAAHLHHPNVVTLYDAGRWEGGPYLVFELLRGETLEKRLRRGPLPVREALRIAREVARALAHAHASGVVHRDLKPANVYLDEDGAVKVLDLGLALVSGAGAAGNAGTPAYMAPEQWRGEPEDARSDVWSAGIILHEMLTGARPAGVSTGGRAQAAGQPSGQVLRGPILPRAPEPVRRVVARALSADREARLADGAALLKAILDAERALDRRRRRLLAAVVAAGALGAAAGGALAMLLLGRGVDRAERLGVAIADVENRTGEPELDGLSGLVATSLEQSRRLNVLGRGRLFDLMRQEGRTASRIDAAVARDLARRAGARAVLVPVVRKSGANYAVDLAAIDAASGDRLFALTEEGSAKAAIPAVVDQLSGRAREELKETAPEVKASRVEISHAVTSSLEAYQHYYEGQACYDRPSRGPDWHALDCAEHFKKALAVDPEFALAHYELAWLAVPDENSLDRQRELLAPALKTLDRVPPKERQIILAWKAHIDGDDSTALSIYRAVVATWPEDKRGVYLEADLLHHQGHLAEAVPLLERVLALDPEFEFALDHAIEDLGYLGRKDRLQALAARLEAATPTASALHALTSIRGWLGDAGGAVDAARRSVASGGGEAAQADLLFALLFAGDLDAAEAELRARRRGEPTSARIRWQLVRVLASQGRRREALALADELVRGQPTSGERIVNLHRRAHLATGFQDAAAVRAVVRTIAPISPSLAARLAVEVAYAGDVTGAARLARDLPKGSAAAAVHEGVAFLRSGQAARATEVLRAIPLDDDLMLPKDAPIFLLGEALAGAGRDQEAADALARFQAIYHPTGFWRSWAVPRSQLLRARALDHLGRRAEARAEVQAVLRQLARADPDLPMLVEARKLNAQFAAPQTPPADGPSKQAP
jgi:tetratricopeptide (TPR) repeat protein